MKRLFLLYILFYGSVLSAMENDSIFDPPAMKQRAYYYFDHDNLEEGLHWYNRFMVRVRQDAACIKEIYLKRNYNTSLQYYVAADQIRRLNTYFHQHPNVQKRLEKKYNAKQLLSLLIHDIQWVRENTKETQPPHWLMQEWGGVTNDDFYGPQKWREKREDVIEEYVELLMYWQGKTIMQWLETKQFFHNDRDRFYLIP